MKTFSVAQSESGPPPLLRFDDFPPPDGVPINGSGMASAVNES